MLILWITALKFGSVLSSVTYGYKSQRIFFVSITAPMKVLISDYFHTEIYSSSSFQTGKRKGNWD